MIRNNKRAIELSINFVVLIILGIAMLTGALFLSNKLFSQAKKYQESVDQRTEEQIKTLITDSDSLVVIYPTRKTINRKKSATFGIGVQNIRTDSQSPTDTFEIAVNFNQAFDNKEEDICDGLVAGPVYRSKVGTLCQDLAGSNPWVNLGNPIKSIKKNEVYTFNALISVPAATPSGVYIFDVEICETDKNCNSPNELYDKISHKIYVRVQ